MNLTLFYTNTFGTTELWGLNLGFYFTMLAVLIIVVIENVVFWSMKKKAVTTDDFLFALKNDAELETIEKLYESSSEKFLLLKNADFYLEEALRNQTHDEVIRFLYRNFEFSENITDDRKFMMLAWKIPILILQGCIWITVMIKIRIFRPFPQVPASWHLGAQYSGLGNPRCDATSCSCTCLRQPSMLLTGDNFQDFLNYL